ncbi:YbaK/EbsC family protein, partial [Campylobacter concisus]|uniref:YbaK/EbsC family protein n=1 Tax=Campylobacter concisus TaxID=199 RepID=UPI0023DE0030
YMRGVLEAAEQADLDQLAEKIDGNRTRPAILDDVTALSDCVFSSVPPFSYHKKLHLVVDESLLERNEEIDFNAGLLDRSLVLNEKDYAKIVRPTRVKFVKEKWYANHFLALNLSEEK